MNERTTPDNNIILTAIRRLAMYLLTSDTQAATERTQPLKYGPSSERKEKQSELMEETSS
jgi:hypothetical protein